MLKGAGKGRGVMRQLLERWSPVSWTCGRGHNAAKDYCAKLLWEGLQGVLGDKQLSREMPPACAFTTVGTQPQFFCPRLGLVTKE